MKTSRNDTNQQSKQERGNKPIPDVRDNMDSRHNKESTHGTNDQISTRKGNKEPQK